MNFKIDTREKFTIITPISDFFSDNLTAEFSELIYSYEQAKINLVINFKNVFSINEQLIKQIAAWHQEFYSKNLSFVICELQPTIKNFLKKNELNDIINVVPAETEAWDIVQMETIERELLDDDNAD